MERRELNSIRKRFNNTAVRHQEIQELYMPQIGYAFSRRLNQSIYLVNCAKQHKLNNKTI